jgi:peptidoglycan/LPS O-acetylase OafA/YrhL
LGQEAPTTLAIATDRSGRILCLDGLRGLASMMVLAHHFGPHLVREGGPFAFLHLLPDLGFAGVDLFFVLSGFLIGGILLDARASSNYYQTFYLRRAFRLLPPYYLSIIGYMVAAWLFAGTSVVTGRLFQDPLPVWPYWLYLQNFSMTFFDTFGPIWLAGAWSLAVEEQFYLLLPGVVRHLSPRNLWRACWLALAFSIGVRVLNSKLHFMPTIGSQILLPTRMDGLAIGVAIAYAIRFQADIVNRWRRVLPWLAAGAAAAWIAYCFLPVTYGARLGNVRTTLHSVMFGLILLSLILFPQSRPSRLLSLTGMRTLGTFSYSIYLFHPIVLCIVFRLYSGMDPQLNGVADLIPIGISLLLVLAAAFCSWNLFEKPLLRLGHRFRYF